MKNTFKSTSVSTLKRLGGSAVIVTSLLLGGGCTTTQQDDLFTGVISLARDSAGLEVKVAPAGDVNLTYMERQASDSKKAESIVLLHGFSANKDNWILFTKALDQKYHVIAVDLAGHGDSEKLLTTDYDLIKQAERLNSLLSGLGIDSFHLAGNSMGGAISAIYSLSHPNKVKSLALIDAAGIEGDTESEYYKVLAEGKNPLIATDEASFEYRMGFTMSQPPFLPWPLRPAFLRQTLEREGINKKVFSDMVATKERLQLVDFSQQIKTVMAKYKVPTIIMWGKEDRVLDVSAVAAFKEIIPNASVHIFEGVGHLPMIEIPDESAGVYQQFLSTVE
ncbi:MAG: abhydrolase domain-containing protein 6 [Glaciecola sp.]|jgi:pimeloyl-ACP methyl ester carboxylesterase